jgi:hypothetical protein
VDDVSGIDSLASDYDVFGDEALTITQEHLDKLRDIRLRQEECGYKDGWVFYELCKFYPKNVASYLSNINNWR